MGHVEAGAQPRRLPEIRDLADRGAEPCPWRHPAGESALPFEAANVRHQHEMEVWKETKLAPGTILMPGVISHATNIVEHPELIARRLVDWAGIVGRQNVVGGADCGMGGRVHSESGWTKLAALAEGAALATKTLWH